MNITNKLKYLALLLICTSSFSISAAQTKAKSFNKNINAHEVNTKKKDICAEISKAIRNIRAINDLEPILKRYGVAKVRACEEQLKSDRSVKQSLRTLQIKSESKQQRKFRSYKTIKLKQNIKVNQRIEKLKLIGARKARTQRNGSNSRSRNNRNNQNTSPIISNITPATAAPGINVIIEGSGFGNNQGSVTLKVSGKSFDTVINAWQDDWINIYLPESISRVHQTNHAVIVVKMNNQRTLNFDLPFYPIKEQRVVSGWFMEFNPLSIFEFAGHSGETTVFKNIQLKNKWVVADFSFSDSNEGSCTKGSPFVENGDSQLDSKIKWSHKHLEPLSCGIEVVIEGDKGFDPEVEEHNRSRL